MADFVLRNVRVVELGRGRGWVGPVDVFVEQGTVREIGHGLDHPAGIEEYDAQGRWAIPGLWDAHVHLAQWTARRDRLDLAGTGSPDRGAGPGQRPARHPARPARRPPATAPGSGPSSPPSPRSTRSRPDVPVVLIAGDAHHAWLNSRALVALGLPDREGVVAENEWYEAYTRIDTVLEPDVSPAAYRRTLEQAAALGITGVVDLERGADGR